jgi:ankyrin repeat protein
MRNWFRYALYVFVLIGCSHSHGQSYVDFFRAVDRDDAGTVTQLLAQGFDPNSRDERGQTALHLALRDHSPKVAEALWKHPGLDVNAHNAADETPLMMAALRGQLEWARRLIDRGAALHQEGWSPVHYAATGPEPKLVALLLDRGAPIDALSPNRTTPLMMAAGYGAEGSVDLLLARGADPRRRNDRGLDAAAFARQAGREFVMQRLEPRAR